MTLVFTLSLSLSLWSEVVCPSPGLIDSGIVFLGTWLYHGHSTRILFSEERWETTGRCPLLGIGGWVGVLDWKAIYWAFTHTRRPTLGAWVLCWWALGYILMLQVQGIFLTLRFNQEHWAGKDPAFPTCMNFFLWGRWQRPRGFHFL